MTLPAEFIGFVCLLLAVGLTFVLPVQRGRLSNQVWDLFTFGLCLAGVYFINYFDVLSNLIIGVIAGFVAVLIRDFRLWAARFRDRVYNRSHRYYWYGRTRSWFGGRRRRW